jgi:hypothetical protein
MDRSATWFCTNPQCDHKTWSAQEQARHMAQEFWALTKVVIRLAPESPEALALTGGVILSELTDEECRAARMAYDRYQKAGRLDELTADARLGYNEYRRRLQAGLLEEDLTGWRRGQVEEFCRKRGHEMSGENVYISPTGKRGCRECRKLARRERERVLTPEQRARNAETTRLWRQTPEGREWEAEYNRRRRENPEVRERVNRMRRARRARKKAERDQGA